MWLDFGFLVAKIATMEFSIMPYFSSSCEINPKKKKNLNDI